MNERTKELAEQAGLSIDKYGLAWDKDNPREIGVDLERFAELVRQDEREACAKLCDNWGHDLVEGNYAAKTIRARSEPSPAFKNYMGDNWAGIV